MTNELVELQPLPAKAFHNEPLPSDPKKFASRIKYKWARKYDGFTLGNYVGKIVGGVFSVAYLTSVVLSIASGHFWIIDMLGSQSVGGVILGFVSSIAGVSLTVVAVHGLFAWAISSIFETVYRFRAKRWSLQTKAYVKDEFRTFLEKNNLYIDEKQLDRCFKDYTRSDYSTILLYDTHHRLVTSHQDKAGLSYETSNPVYSLYSEEEYWGDVRHIAKTESQPRQIQRILLPQKLQFIVNEIEKYVAVLDSQQLTTEEAYARDRAKNDRWDVIDLYRKKAKLSEVVDNSSLPLDSYENSLNAILDDVKKLVHSKNQDADKEINSYEEYLKTRNGSELTQASQYKEN